MKHESRRLEAVVAAFLTLAAVWLNYLSTASAGGLWRDEANTVALANLPRIVDVWQNLQFDSFPIVWLAIVRGFSAVFGAGNDSAFRVLGFLIGVALIASLWLNARNFGYRFPFVALALVAVAPSVVRWGDSMRAYGLAMVLIVLTISAVWKYVHASSSRNLIVAGAMAMLSVHTIYYNSVLLFAICAGAAAVCIRRRKPKSTAGIIGIGFVSAISLTLYSATIRGAGGWNSLVRIPAYTTEWFFVKLYETLAPAGWLTFILWMTVLLFCLAIGTLGAATNAVHLSEERKNNVLFATITLVVGTLGSFLFLRTLSYSTQPWYYLTLVLIAGVSMDIIIGSMVAGSRTRAFLSVATLVGGFASAIAGSGYLRTRSTNADLVASRLESITSPSDMIIVNPWYDGVSFNRYYHGNTAWQTAPPISFHAFHRYDMVMKLTALPAGAAMAPVLEAAQRVLLSGSTVFVVGALPKAPPAGGHAPSPYAAADAALQTQWADELAELIRTHAANSEPVTLQPNRPVSRYESMTITAIRGWR